VVSQSFKVVFLYSESILSNYRFWFLHSRTLQKHGVCMLYAAKNTNKIYIAVGKIVIFPVCAILKNQACFSIA
jgi:hypothetical protein